MEPGGEGAALLASSTREEKGCDGAGRPSMLEGSPPFDAVRWPEQPLPVRLGLDASGTGSRRHAIPKRQPQMDLNVSGFVRGCGWVRGRRLGWVLEHRERERPCRQGESRTKQLHLAHHRSPLRA